MVPGALKNSGKEDDNCFCPIINSTAVLDVNKRVSHMHFCTHSGSLQSGISQANYCQRHILLLLKRG